MQDKSAVGFSHKEEVPKHSSQKGLTIIILSLKLAMIDYPFIFFTDYSVGFGGKYGVQKEEPSRAAPAPVPAPAPKPVPVVSAPKVAEKPASPVTSSRSSGGSRISDMKAK